MEPDATRADAAAWHAGVLVIAVLMRVVIGHQRSLPWGFFGRVAQPRQAPDFVGD